MSARLHHSIASARVALCAAGLVLAAACAPVPEDAHWSPAQSPKENKVVLVRHAHMVEFEPGKDFLSDAERRRLDAFLEREGVGYGERIAVTFPMDPGDPAAERTAKRRADVVAGYVSYLGFTPAIRPKLVDRPERTVEVTVGRHVVIPPACPDWTKPAEADPGNTVSSNFGCATASNLGLMVADPADLMLGRSAPVSDAERAAGAIERYRKGEEKEIEEELTSE